MESFFAQRSRAAVPTSTVPTARSGPAAGLARLCAEASNSGGHAASKVECQREGDRITRLTVVCACGERIEIDCLYHT